MRDAVIVSTARTPIGKAHRGAFNATLTPTLAAHAVKAAQSAGVDLSELPLATLQGFHPAIAADVFEVLSLEGSLNARATLGGTAPVQVRVQIARHLDRLKI